MGGNNALRLRLLGTPDVAVDEVSVIDSLPGKTQAVLYYLAATGQAQTRVALAGLLWGDMPESAARTNLRKALSPLRATLDPFLNIDRQSIALKKEGQYWVDVVDFEAQFDSRHTNSAALQAAVDLYRGHFLAGFYVRNAPDFEVWMTAEQARLREMAIQMLNTLAEHQAQQGQLSHSIATLRRLLTLESWREEIHRQLMLVLAEDGQRGAALAQYDICRQILADELAVEPDSETVDLYERIRDAKFNRTVKAQPSPADKVVVPAEPPHNLPPQSTSFVGRKQELADVIRRLLDIDCRLLSLVGPGGIGKTRLAIQTGQSILSSQPMEIGGFQHGIFFVSLTAANSTSGIISTIAKAIGFDFHGTLPQSRQLIDYLSDKTMLLILDNFEHLLPSSGGDVETTTFVSDMLGAASQLKILATSREALNIQEEWFHPVAGLTFPGTQEPSAAPVLETETNASETSFEAYDAIQLFVQTALRAKVVFSLEQERAHVIRICQMVEGMPLGIELAAAWLKMLPAEQIANEIEHDLDILSTRLQNVPSRHRSLRAVFEHSWQLLSEKERTVLKRLSVFRGSFQQQATEAVADASLMTLATLMDKSLVRATVDGRYQMHELLRQFAAEKLADTPQEEAVIREQHSAYYLAFLKDREAVLTSKDQRRALEEINEELDNIRIGWNCAVDQGYLAAIGQAVKCLYRFYLIRSRYREGQELLEYALVQLQQSEMLIEHPAHETILHRLIARLGSLCFYIGDSERAIDYLETSLLMATDPHELIYIHNTYGQVLHDQGHRETAEVHHNKALALSREIDDPVGTADALLGLAGLAVGQGKYDLGKEMTLESLALYRQEKLTDRVVNALGMMGWTMNSQGDYQASEVYLQEFLSLSQELGDQANLGLALDHLGWNCWCIGGERLAESFYYYERALAVFRKIGYQSHLSMCLGDISLIALETGHYEKGRASAQEGLAIAKSVGHQDLITYNLYCLGGLACELGNFAASRRYLAESLDVSFKLDIYGHILINLYYVVGLWLKEGNIFALAEAGKLHERELAQIARMQLLLDLVQEHFSTWHVYREKALQLTKKLQGLLPPEQAAAIEQESSESLETVVAEVLTELRTTPS